MPSLRCRIAIAYVFAISLLQGCATEPAQPLDQKPLFQLERDYDAVKTPQCLAAFAPYCKANGYKVCPEAVPTDRLTGPTLVYWRDCEVEYNAYLEKQDAIGEALDKVFDRAKAALPACVNDARDIPPAFVRDQGINPALPDVAARLIVWGTLLEWKGMSTSCVEDLCRFQHEYLKQYADDDHYCYRLQLLRKKEQS